MKKFLFAASVAALASPAFADTLDVTVTGTVPVYCGLNFSYVVGAASTTDAVHFDFADVKTSATTNQNTYIQAKQAGGGSSFRPIVAYCNAVGGVDFAWTVNPLVHEDGVITNPADVIDYKVDGSFHSPYGAVPNRINTGFTAGAQLTGSNTEAFASAGPFVATGVIVFRAKGVQNDDGTYAKHAGLYEGSFALTLTAN